MTLAVGSMSVVQAVNAVVSGTAYVVGILDTALGPKNYTQVATSGTLTNNTEPTLIPAIVPGIGGLPTISAVSVVLASDGNGGGVNGGSSDNSGALLPGYVKLTLSPNAADVVNASSPMQVTVSPNAYIILSSLAS